jgi:hypothetical protein
MQKNIKSKDALHLSCAIEAECKYFITTDRKILNKSIEAVAKFSFQLPTYQGSVLEAFRRTKHGPVAKLIEFCNRLY